MASSNQLLLSPAELSYLQTSLSVHPPIRPDGRSPTQFRPLTAETGILPGTNGSARVCLADGTEAIVGVKAEVEKTTHSPYSSEDNHQQEDDGSEDRKGRGDWLEMAVDVPGQRDDDSATVFLSEMLREALLADGELAKKLIINRRFHWRVYLDIILISPPMSYPLPLLSLTTHLALLATRLPRLKSEGDEDPMFDDDWDASEFLYPQEGARGAKAASGSDSRPSITLLVVAIGDNIIFDPSREELAVAETALAVSVAEVRTAEGGAKGTKGEGMDVDSPGRSLRLLSVRTIDPPSRLTAPGIPDEQNTATNVGSGAGGVKQRAKAPQETGPIYGVWRAPLGGTKFGVMDRIIRTVLEKGGVGEEVLDGLQGVDLG